MKTKEPKCSCCGKKANFFHSGCCMSHFEGIIDKGIAYVACEKCGNYVGTLIYESEMKNKKWKI